jgi:hypothetical protein
MVDLIVPKGTFDIVNLLESKPCCFCGEVVAKRRQMWKFIDGNYMCIPCKTRFDAEIAKEEMYSTDNATVALGVVRNDRRK